MFFKYQYKCFKFVRPLLAGVLWFSASLAHAEVKELDHIVAIVNNDVIMQSQLKQSMAEARALIARRQGSVPDDATLRKQVLDQLILENIQLQMAHKADLTISKDDLDQAMQSIAQRNNMSLNQFRQVLAKQGLTFDQARDQIRRRMLIQRVRDAMVLHRVQVSDQEVKNFMNSDLGRLHLSDDYHLAQIYIPIRDESSPQSIQQAQAKAEQIYEKASQGADFAKLAIANSADENAFNGGEIGWRKSAELPAPFDRIVPELSPGQVTKPVHGPGGFIIVKVLDKHGASDVVEDEVHVRHILLRPSKVRSEEEAKRLIDRIYERLQNGEDFATLAKNFSEDPSSAMKGGDLGWLPPQATVPEFRKMMETTPAGEITKPFRTAFGWHIMQVLERRSTDKSAQARELEAKNLLRNHKAEERLQSWLREIRANAYVEIKDQPNQTGPDAGTGASN